MVIGIKKIIGHILDSVLNRCPYCGKKMILLYIHGFDSLEVWKCPECDKEYIEEYKKFKEGLKKYDKVSA